MKRFCRWISGRFYRIPNQPRNISVTIFFQIVAYVVSSALIGHTGAENNSALVYVLAVVLTSLLTTGYFYGILSSIISGFCINFYFMLPYAAFTLSYTGYPMAMFSMVVISCVVCALTTRVKLQAQEAAKREQATKDLYELYSRLNEEKNSIQLEMDREAIRSNILRSVSHDLRTPLTSISGSVSVLLSNDDIPPANAQMLLDIKNDADSLITMVENLLSVTRIQDSTAPLKTREEMLEEVAGDALLTITRRFPNAHVAVELSEDILFLPMEPMLIKQVIVNLLENSIRHSGNPSSITLNLFRRDNWAIVEVRDKGKGLSHEVLHAVQQNRPLPRDLSGDSTRGMGIGLSVCQSIVKAHNGFFSAGNDPEGGAVFRFGLPLEESES
ncbi:MAG: DUF4118 domain-containing protein [Clostridium sp.]|nr:DUF4118 domain-containing protein [Clostridium sp.]